ncbi:MAG: cellulose synthase subunit BcsC-related outer membrane protein [Candidatus Methylacidiphilales bacterium]
MHWTKMTSRLGRKAGARRVALCLATLAGLLMTSGQGMAQDLYVQQAQDTEIPSSPTTNKNSNRPRTPEEAYQDTLWKQLTGPDAASARKQLEDTQDVTMTMRYGWFLYEGKHYADALTWFERVLVWDAQNAGAAKGVVLSHVGMGELKKAKDMAQRYASLDSLLEKLVPISAEEQVSQLMRPEGEMARKQLEIDKNVGMALKLAWSLYDDKRPAEALPWFQKILAWDDQNPVAAKGVVVCRVALNQFDEAEKDALKYAALDPLLIKLVPPAYKGQVEEMKKNTPAGTAARKKVEDNKDTELAAQLGWALFEDERTSDALPWFEKALLYDSKNAVAAKGLIVSLVKLNLITRAEAAAAKYSALDPQLAGLVPSAQTALVNKMMAPGGEELLAKLVENKDIGLGLRLAWAYYDAKRFADSTTWFQRLLEWDTTNAVAAKGLVLSYVKSSDFPAAEAAVRQYETLDPTLKKLLPTYSKDRASKIRQSQDRTQAAAVDKEKDLNTALPLAWSLYDDKHYEESLVWFEKAQKWDHQNDNAGKGAGMARRKIADDWVGQAEEAQKSNRYKDSLSMLDKAQSYSRLDIGGMTVKAWNLFHLQRYAEAAPMFEKLYRLNPRSDLAEGLYYSLKNLGEYDKLSTLSRELGGPFAKLYRTETAKEYVDRGLPIAGHNLDPNIPGLKNVDTKNIVGGLGIREKSGDSGTSKLSATTFPLAQYNLVLPGLDDVMFEAKIINLDAGNFRENSALIGSAPLIAPPGEFESPKTQYTVLEPRLSWRREGWTTYYADLGLTPLGGEVMPALTWHLGMIQQIPDGYWSAELFSESVKESLLSYTGMQDPYTGEGWGRVIRVGVRGERYTEFGGGWGVYMNGQADYLTGVDVDDNTHASATLGLSKNLNIPGFKFFSIGPGVSGEVFQKNLSHYTVGHGGYFSPDYILQGVMSVNFLTEEGKRYLVKGYLAGGMQTNKQSESPVLPLDPDGRTYEGVESTSIVMTTRVKGVMLLSDHWQFGGLLSYAKSASYDELNAFMFLRYTFEPRTGLYRRDLPADNP